MANEESAIPEWDWFERLEKLEKMFVTKPTLHDTFVVAMLALDIAFVEAIADHPERARKLKDILMKWVKAEGISKESLENVERMLLEVCEEFEEFEE